MKCNILYYNIIPCNLITHNRIKPLRNNVVSVVPQSPTPQDLSDDALPLSTDVRETYVHGAHKYMQIGTPAALALLQSLTSGADLSGMKAVVLCDLQVKTGEFLEAFIGYRKALPTSFFFVGVCESQVEKDWLEKVWDPDGILTQPRNKTKNRRQWRPAGRWGLTSLVRPGGVLCLNASLTYFVSDPGTMAPGPLIGPLQCFEGALLG